MVLSERLATELAVWRDAGLQVTVWLRDDDATEPTAALDALFALARDHGVAPLIAAISADATPELVSAVIAQPGVRLAAHGWQHHNHAAAGRKSSEFPEPHERRSSAEISGDLSLAATRTRALFGAVGSDVFVPPWNRIAPCHVARLGALGFRALSTYAAAHTDTAAAHGLVIINTQVDLIDWRGTRGGKPLDVLMDETAQAMAVERAAGRTRIGILSHHLAHDAAAWTSLAGLLSALSRSGCVCFEDAAQLPV